MGVINIKQFGDPELVVFQIKGIYTTKHPSMRSYLNAVWDIVENYFDAFHIATVHMEDNQ